MQMFDQKFVNRQVGWFVCCFKLSLCCQVENKATEHEHKHVTCAICQNKKKRIKGAKEQRRTFNMWPAEGSVTVEKENPFLCVHRCVLGSTYYIWCLIQGAFLFLLMYFLALGLKWIPAFATDSIKWSRIPGKCWFSFNCSLPQCDPPSQWKFNPPRFFHPQHCNRS